MSNGRSNEKSIKVNLYSRGSSPSHMYGWDAATLRNADTPDFGSILSLVWRDAEARWA